MNVQDAHTILRDAHGDFARFYGSADGLDWGVGLIVNELAFPIYDKIEGEFTVVTGLVYVLSHECDIDSANDRPYNDSAVVCPIVPFDRALEDLNSKRSHGQVQNFVTALSKNTVDRASYIPSIDTILPYGGLLYLNMMSHTNVAEFSRNNVEKVCAVSVYGLRYLDTAIHNSLLKRPKAQELPHFRGSTPRASQVGVRPKAAGRLKELLIAARNRFHRPPGT